MQLQEAIHGSLKTLWLAGTHIKSIKRHTLIKFTIYQAVNEIKENTNLTLKQLAILTLGICKIYYKLIDFLKEEQMKILSNSFETPHKPRLSEVENSNQLLIQSSLRYSGEGLKMLTGSHKKNEDFRQGMVPKDILGDLELVSVSENRIFFGEDAYIEPSFHFINTEIDQNMEILTPKIENRSNKSGFPTSIKSTVKKKRVFDDVTLIKRYKDLPVRENFEKIKEKIEIPALPEEIFRFFKDFSDFKEEIQIDGVVDDGSVHNFLNFSGGFNENQEFQVELNVTSERTDGIIPFNLETAFESDQNLYLEYKSPVKNTQNLRFEEKIAGLIDQNGKCWFSDIVLGVDRHRAALAFSLLLVSANTKGLMVRQEYSQDIEIIWMKDLPMPKIQLSGNSYSGRSQRVNEQNISRF